MQGLVLHAGADTIPFDDLRNLPVPAATATHVPIPHHRLVEMLRHSLTFYNHEIVEEHFGITKDGARFFGLMSLKSDYGDYTDTVGLRNSHDRSFPVGVAYGSRVFICDNLAFMGEHIIKRKHTVNALRDIHALMADLVAPLADERRKQHETITRYKEFPLADRDADHIIMEAYRRDVVNLTRVPEVLKLWNHAQDPDSRTMWKLFNAFTAVLVGRVAEKPALTQELHSILDNICMN